MAESFIAPPSILTFTLGLADVATQLDFPNRARSVRLHFVANAGKVAVAGTDAAAIDANHMLVPADTDYEINIDSDSHEGGKGPVSIFVASATGSTVVRALVTT